MTKTSYEELERLDQLASIPTEQPSDFERSLQEEGDDPLASFGGLTNEDRMDELAYRKENAFVIASEYENTRQTLYDGFRETNIPRVYWLVSLWLIFVAITIVLVGSSVLVLSEAVLITLITTTTVTILGMFVLILKWLFYTDNK